LDSHGIQGIPALTTAQIVSLVAIAIAAGLFILRIRRAAALKEVTNER
jgi:hypothetical protein